MEFLNKAFKLNEFFNIRCAPVIRKSFRTTPKCNLASTSSRCAVVRQWLTRLDTVSVKRTMLATLDCYKGHFIRHCAFQKLRHMESVLQWLFAIKIVVPNRNLKVSCRGFPFLIHTLLHLFIYFSQVVHNRYARFLVRFCIVLTEN